ncbi:MAG: prepilin-type N-terminal cleavage/methylation domain-containing protein [candidate division Zixibacteria bacterium]|nr:prepilin-type N-terminal cleavage/methylation domain-containing protein [candidate division Zixibacteria bacterium]
MFRLAKLKNNFGFTMLEIMISVVLVGILSSMAAPRFLDFIQRAKGRADAATNVSYMRAARSQAVTTGVPTGVKFDTSNKQIIVFSDLDGNGLYSAFTDSMTLPALELKGDTNIENCTFGNDVVIFNTDGTANVTGQVEFSIGCETTRTYVVDVLASTGKVKLTKN